MKSTTTWLTATVAVALLSGGCTRPLETRTDPGQVSPARATAIGPATSADAEPVARHPDAPERRDRTDRLASTPSDVSLAGFSTRYREAGSPRVAILFNRQFGTQLTSWTMDSAEIFQEVRADHAAGEIRGEHFPTGEVTRASVQGEGVEITRSESFRQYQDGGARAGFSSEYVEWKFREGFARPFGAAGVRLIDSDLVVQAAGRGTEGGGNQRILDVNANLEAMREKTDWIVEVLMVADSRAATGYVFRAEAKELATGRVMGSAMTNIDDFRERPVRRTITAAPGGYRVVEEELPGPTLEEYAEDLAIRLLSSLTKRMADE